MYSDTKWLENQGNQSEMFNCIKQSELFNTIKQLRVPFLLEMYSNKDAF